MELVRPFISAIGLTNMEVVGEGLEFVVFKIQSPEFACAALRVPKYRIFQNVNDPNLDAVTLLEQELRIYEVLYGGSVPVPKPFRLLDAGGYPAMLCEFVESDGSSVTAGELGRIAALIHRMTLSGSQLSQMVAQEGRDTLTTIVERMLRRFGELVQEVPSALQWIPHQRVLEPIAEQLRRLPNCLLHMDLRDANLRSSQHRVTAVIDWSNALIGPNVLDVFRILELVQPGEEFLHEYSKIHTLPNLTPEEETFLRLDAALMLALVFISEEPDAERREPAVERVKTLAAALGI